MSHLAAGRPFLGRTSPRVNCDPRRPYQRLQHDAVALGRGNKIGELLGSRRGLEVEVQANVRESNRSIPINGQGAPEIKVAFGPHGALD